VVVGLLQREADEPRAGGDLLDLAVEPAQTHDAGRAVGACGVQLTLVLLGCVEVEVGLDVVHGDRAPLRDVLVRVVSGHG
jgi:hypothetical protein